MQYISKDNILNLLSALRNDYAVYTPVKKGEQRFYRRYTVPDDDIVIGEVRPFEPLKAFFSHAKEVVAEGFKPDVPRAHDKPLAIVGVKACDLKGFKVQDHVFLNHDYKDPFYIRNRENNLIISSDCTCGIDTCFCIALGVKPYPVENFDINLSEAAGGFIVEVGSKKGEGLVKKHSSFFEVAEKKSITERDAVREKVLKRVEKNISENNIPRQDAYEGVI